jgi:hypothetical protein
VFPKSRLHNNLITSYRTKKPWRRMWSVEVKLHGFLSSALDGCSQFHDPAGGGGGVRR